MDKLLSVLPWDLQFPVMIILDAGAWVAVSESELTTMHRTIVQTMYRGLLVDSQGRAMRVVKAEEDRPAGFWKRLRQARRQEVPVKLTFGGELRTLSLDELSAMLFESLDRRPDSLKAFQGETRLESLRRDVAAATSFAQVFQLVLEFDRIPRELL